MGQSNLYASNGGKREIYNNKAPGITGTSGPRRPVVGCNRWRHKPMSTRNLEFLTLSRWLPTTRGSRHLIALTATNVLHPSLFSSSFPPLSVSVPITRNTRDRLLFLSHFLLASHLCSSLGCPFLNEDPRPGSIPRVLHAESTRLFYKLPCVAIVARAVGLVISAAWLAQAVRP